MALTNADNPTADQPEQPAAKSSKSKAAKAEAAVAPQLAKAFTSGNADVHNLLAEREIALSNGDSNHVADVDARLAALGYAV